MASEAEQREKKRERSRRYYAENRAKILARQKEYYRENREAILERHKKFREANPEHVRATVRKSMERPEAKAAMRKTSREWRKANPERSRQYSHRWQRDNPETAMLYRARRRARVAGVPFTITRKDVAIPEFCPVFPWIRLERAQGRMGPQSPSLDRIVPELGYVPGNVVVVSNRANVLKRDATAEELMHLAAFYVEAGGG